MTNYKPYINALRQCAKEHENDITPFAHIIVSDLCKDTANLLEKLEQEPRKGYISIDDVMLVFDDYMRGEVDAQDTETFLEMLKDKAESE